MGRTITWGELITVVLFILGAALLFYLVLAAANLVRMLGNINKLVESTRPNLEKTMANLPEISDNATKITGLLKDNMESVTKLMTNVGKISDTAKTAADIIQKDIIVKAKGLLDVADGIRRHFVKKKKDGGPTAKTGSAVYRYTYRKGQENPDEVLVVIPAAARAETTDTICPDKNAYKADEKGKGQPST